MSARRSALIIVFLVASNFVGCQSPPTVESSAPPPEAAQRPVLKTEAELAAERAGRIELGQQVPASTPILIGAERAQSPKRDVPPPAPFAKPGAISADVLMVNDQMVTVAEVLFGLHEELEELRGNTTAAGFRERATALIRSEVQRTVGSILIYREATSALTEQQRTAIDNARQKEIENVKARRFNGSDAKFKAYLEENGLTLDQFQTALERDMIVRQYTRERLLGSVSVRRDELLSYFERNKSEFGAPETREFQLIELPFSSFLPAGQTWAAASNQVRAQAKLAAVRRAREAHEALASRPFDEVAREFSTGPRQERGGSWGLIGKPLQTPYDKLSAMIFEFTEGQHSEPIEQADGWYIVRCGRIEPGESTSFLEVQDEIRRALTDARYNQLSREYVMRLASKATVSSIDQFVKAAVARATRG